MDATSPEMIDFVIVPLETIVAHIFILWNVLQTIKPFRVPGVAEGIEELYDTSYNLIQETESWPLIVKENSRCHITIMEIHEATAKWLRRSPLFDDTRKELAQYLELPSGFSASKLVMRDNGAIVNREAIRLKQTRRNYYKERLNQESLLVYAKKNEQEYRAFLTRLMWMRDDPLVRMFESDFKGEFQDHSKVNDTGGLSYQLESFSVADGASTIAMGTPSTTRATSPALTEGADNDTAKSNAIKLPTLKYIAIIETDNDNKAIFDLEFSDVNQDKHKVLVIAKDMCTEMVSKGYESKVKLQDIMEMAVKMAKK